MGSSRTRTQRSGKSLPTESNVRNLQEDEIPGRKFRVVFIGIILSPENFSWLKILKFSVKL